MVSKKKRNVVFSLNKYQRLIIYPVLATGITTCFSSVLCFMFIYCSDDLPITNNIQLSQFKFLIPITLITLNVLSIFIIFWTYYMSGKIAGPVGRIARELNNILEGKETQPLKARKGDEMFEGLLDQMNKLIK